MGLGTAPSTIIEVPRQCQIGRYGPGFMITKQKVDLMTWARLRETSNSALTKTEILSAMKKYMLNNRGVAHTPDVDMEHAFRTYFPQADMDAIYHDWRHWIRKNVTDPRMHISTSRKAKALRQVEAKPIYH